MAVSFSSICFHCRQSKSDEAAVGALGREELLSGLGRVWEVQGKKEMWGLRSKIMENFKVDTGKH
jgi:hypothetical protein